MAPTIGPRIPFALQTRTTPVATPTFAGADAPPASNRTADKRKE